MEKKIKTEIVIYSFKNMNEEVQTLEDYYTERRDQIILSYLNCSFESEKFAHVFKKLWPSATWFWRKKEMKTFGSRYEFDVYSFSHVRLFVSPWTVALQAPLFMVFFRQEYWSGLLFPSPRGLSDQGIEPTFPALAGGFFTIELPRMPILLLGNN